MKGKKGIVCCVFALTGAFTACGGEKHITVISRTAGSGTRSAFETLVTDGEGNALGGKDENGKEYSLLVKTALEKSDTGDVKTAVTSDKNAIGYISVGSLDSSVKALDLDGVSPTAKNVELGTYAMQRPFVIMTNATVSLTPRAEDFVQYLKSTKAEEFSTFAGCVWASDPIVRGSQDAPVPVVEDWTAQPTLPLAGESGKIVINGSTSMQKFIEKAASAYAEEYAVKATDIFTIELQSSSVGRKGAETDDTGNFIGLSSASVQGNVKVKAFTVCLDAIAVIVHNDCPINGVTTRQLFDIYTGKILSFRQLEGVSV